MEIPRARIGRKTILLDKVHLNKQKTLDNKYTQYIKDHLSSKSVNNSSALDSIIYGISCSRVKEGKLLSGVMMVSDNLSTIFFFLELTTNQKHKIDLLEITQISLDFSRGDFMKLKDKSILKSGSYVSILSQTESYDLIFNSSEECDLFLKSIMLMMQNDSCEQDTFKENIKKIWMVYDNDFSGKMEFKEFEKFLKDLHIRLLNQSVTELFAEIDIDKSGEIDFEEFVEYYKKFSCGVEFKTLFEKYSDGKLFMSAKDLLDFFTEEQGEVVNESEAAIIILQFKQDANREDSEQFSKKLIANHTNNNEYLEGVSEEEKELLKLNLSEFKKLLSDRHFTSVYDEDNVHTMQDMTRPLYEYFINSSHNTYLSGHQLYGSSSVEMYNYALLKGYRLVELDCWDGDEVKGPIITHGFTFTSKILLKDVLQAIRKTAFVASEFPVILSIENHLNKKQQDIMADYFQKYLIDLYIIDPENPPENYPSPNDLRNKFVIKCGRPRIYKSTTEKLNTIKSEEADDLKSKDDVSPMKKNLISFFRKKKDNNTNGDNVSNGANGTKKEIKSLFLKSIVTSINKENKEVADIENMLMNLAGNNNGNSKALGSQKKEEEEFDVKKVKKKSEDSHGKLAKCVGLVGTKLKIDKLKENIYQFWDCITITEKKTISFVKDIQKKKMLLSYTRTSLGKSYPLRMDSSNLDTVKSWIAGIQIAAINAQSLMDDFTLLNLVYFKKNNNCGYILKPEKLNDLAALETYEKSCGTLTLNLISGFNLQLLISDREKVNELSITTYIIGSFADDENNKKHITKINHNLLNPLFNNESFTFRIYEKELSFIYIKILNKNNLVGRAVMPLSMMSKGIRVVPLYDNLCREYRNSHLTFHITKAF